MPSNERVSQRVAQWMAVAAPSPRSFALSRERRGAIPSGPRGTASEFGQQSCVQRRTTAEVLSQGVNCWVLHFFTIQKNAHTFTKCLARCTSFFSSFFVFSWPTGAPGRAGYCGGARRVHDRRPQRRAPFQGGRRMVRDAGREANDEQEEAARWCSGRQERVLAALLAWPCVRRGLASESKTVRTRGV